MGGRWVKSGLIVLAVAIWLVQWVLAMTHPRGDFLLHWEFGRRLQAGEFLYQNGLHTPYPPVWAVPHAPLSLVSPAVAKPIVLLVGAVALIALLWVLHNLSNPILPLREGRLFWVVAATLFILSRFVIRDFDDGGQNLILLTLSWIGLWLFTRGQTIGAGASLGLAIALKCTAGIFVPYFLLKREWKMALATLAWTGLFFLTPMLWQGPVEFKRTVEIWKGKVVEGMAQSDPSMGVLGPENLQNKSLRPALARYLMHLPPGHPGRHYESPLPEGNPNHTPHPWSIEFLDLAPATAGGIIKVVMGLGLLIVGWRMRFPLANGDRLAFFQEAAILSVLGLLYSPITWGQHCVGALPAIYLLVRGVAAGKIQGFWVKGFLLGFTLVLLLTNRSFIGTDLSLLLESYHVFTFTLVGLIVAMFFSPPQVTAINRGISLIENEKYAPAEIGEASPEQRLKRAG